MPSPEGEARPSESGKMMEDHKLASISASTVEGRRAKVRSLKTLYDAAMWGNKERFIGIGTRIYV